MCLICILKMYFEMYILKVVGEVCKIFCKRVMEVMVWVLVDKDKNLKLEIICFFFIVYEL